MTRVIVGVPTLSRGPLLDRVRRLGAPIMVSATALSRWTDQGPLPPDQVFNAMERRIRAARGDHRPPSAAQLRRRIRSWSGWNLAALDRVPDDVEVHVDSAGFVAASHYGGYFFEPEAYILGLVTSPKVHRASAMDFCVEPELAPTEIDIEERLARTVNLNIRCRRLADEAGVGHKLMPVIQGYTPEQYLTCFDRISGTVRPGSTIGVGSMCRRHMDGPNGAVAIVDALHRALPPDVRLHLFGLKSDAAEALCEYGDRIDSVDSQAYGVRARQIANERRRTDPSFSKTNEMLAGVMEEWYLRQVARMASPRRRAHQPVMDLNPAERPRLVIDALERMVRREYHELIADGALGHDQIIGGRMLEEDVLGRAADLPPGVRLGDAYQGEWQLPRERETEDA